MFKQINFFLLLAVITVFAACNNANKPTETVKEQTQAASSPTAKEQAISDVQKAKMMNKQLDERSTISSAPSAKTTKYNGSQGISAEDAAGGATAGDGPMTTADRLRQKAAAKEAGVQNPGRNLVDAAPAVGKEAKKAKEAAKNEAASTIRNAKIPSPTVNTSTQEAPKKMDAAPGHGDWNALLTANVSSSGKVNYKGFKAAQGKLNAYLDKLKSNAPVASWSRNEKMAYWINAYNAFTVKKIVDNYPLGSIQELSGGKVWDDKWINIGDKTYSLNNIENDILRPIYKDARIHFAVNCAAKSCPSLHNRAFTAGNLESKLASLTKKFVNNTDFNTITANKVTVSKIFDWYGSDFGDLKGFLNKYSNTAINADAAVDYTEYNWSLNE